MMIKRRFMALLLTAALILTFMPAAAFADDTPTVDPEVEQQEAVYPVSAKHIGHINGVVGTNTLLNLEDEAQRFVVKFNTGEERTFAYVEKDYEDDEDPSMGFTYGTFVYLDNPDDPESVQNIDPLEASSTLYAEVKEDAANPIVLKEGVNEDVEILLTIKYVVSGEGTDDEVTAVKTIPAFVDVSCMYDSLPLSVTFEPADGFNLECSAGPNYLDIESFYGEGNQFVVKYEGWYADDDGYNVKVFTRHFQYVNKDTESGEHAEGFYLNGDPDRYGIDGMTFDFDTGVYCDVKYGKSYKAEFTHTEYIQELDKSVSIDFAANFKATKYAPVTEFKIYKYTGKNIKPSFKVYDNDNKLISSKQYDVSYEKNSKMGYYEAQISFHDADKYGEPIEAMYGIGPAVPILTKLVPGKKSLTVKWKKLSATSLKNIDGMYIELSTDKYFRGNYKRVYVSKKALKSGKKLVKGLKKGKKYFVSVYTYKTIKQDGEKFKMPSADSKILARKTK